MPPKATLDPEGRSLYGDSLRPPSGYRLDAAVATTYSLDFETTLAVPVTLALFATENRADLLSHPLALLEGAERAAGRVAIYAEAGRLHAESRPQPRLCSLLESMIVEVAAPRGGAFHPKIWVLRFEPVSGEGPEKIRLLVLSRNLTRDRSWDLSLRLDGRIGEKERSQNAALAALVEALPNLALHPVTEEAATLTQGVGAALRRARWTEPEPFRKVSFAVNGLGGRQWRPASCDRLGVLSPFCDETALELLVERSRAGKPLLVSRPDELAAVPLEVLERFADVRIMDEMAVTEDGEDEEAADHQEAPEALTGLHAKAFVAEDGDRTILTVGSGNATRPALIKGSNVEVFATLTGARDDVGGIDDILGPEGFGRLTRSYEPAELPPPNPAVRAAEQRVEQARRELAHAHLALECMRKADSATGDVVWRMVLHGPEALALDGIGRLDVWPITRGAMHCREALGPLRAGGQLDLGAMALADVTRFLAFRLVDETEGASALFTLGLPIKGLPEERHAAILRGIIDNRDAFLRYLRLLLGEFDDPFAGALAAQAGGTQSWAAAADDAPLLEDMVQALCQGGGRLHAVARLMERLEAADDDSVVPEDFLVLWEAFRTVLEDRETTE